VPDRRTRIPVVAAATLAYVLAACGTHAPPIAQQRGLIRDSEITLAAMTSRDPTLSSVLQASAGYAVFPQVGAAGALVVGGAFGRGILYEHGRPSGYVEIKQGSIGVAIGGQTYSEVIVLADREAVEALKAGMLRIGAGASAVILDSGVAAAVRFASGSTVFIAPHGGLMAGLTIDGQSVGFRPLG
jgi:lipid-binding SYLF domain-containing protein